MSASVQPDALAAARDLPGSRVVTAAANRSHVLGRSELVVVAEGTVDAFFVPVDDDGKPRIPLFVGQLEAGQVCVGGWWESPSLGLPAGECRLKTAGEATLLVATPTSTAQLTSPLAEASAAWQGRAVAFAESRRVASLGASDARLDRRRRLDSELEAEGRGALLRVFEERRVADRPRGLPALARALADAADSAGASVDPARLEAATRSGETDVLELAASLHIPIRRTTLSGDGWRCGGPTLLAFDGAEPVVLVPRGRGYAIRDAAGVEVPLTRARAASIDREAYSVYPKLPHRAVGAKDLFLLGLRGGRRWLLFLAGLTVLVAALGAFIPYATAEIIGSIVPSGDSTALGELVAAVAAFTVALFGASVAQALVVLGIGNRAAASLTAALWDRLLHLPPGFFRGRASGALAQQVTAIDQMRTIVSSSLVAALAGAALSLSAIGLLFFYSIPVALVVLLVFVVLLAIAWVFVRGEGRFLQTTLDERNRLNGLLLGLFSGISKLRVAGAERRAHALWARGYALQQQAQQDAAIQRVRLTVLQGIMTGTLLLAVIVAYAIFDEDEPVLLVDFTGSVAASGQLAAAAAAMVTLALAIVRLRPLYRTAAPILERTPEVHESALLPGEIEGAVELDGITFGYAEDAPVLDDVSFAVEPGSFVALVGPSGAGKSTIVRLILGFDIPWQGQVLLDGKPLDRLDQEAVRRRIGTVIQGARITSGSILTNILGALPFSTQDAWEAAEMAGVAEDIRAMPMQMSTMVPEGGSGFSGGQLQRILLARALVRKPRIVLLDEATSALDNETQRIVTENLGALGVTRIVIAHRLSTVRHADKIVVLERGRVVERGTFDELVSAGGLFASLARRQVL